MGTRQDPGLVHGFVGRAAELEVLRAALPGADGGVRLVLVSGEAGIGKTRLVREFFESAERDGLTASWAHCWDDDAVPSFWPWAQLVRQVQGRSRGVELAGLLARDDEVILDQFVLFDATAQLLARAATAGPLVLVLDDIHRADPGSLLLLRYLLACGMQEPVLVVATARDGAGERPEVAEHLAALTRTATSLRLRGLPPDQVRQLVGAEWFTDELYDVSGGNPLYLHQARRAVGPAGAASGARALGDVVAARLDALDPAARSVLVALAVLGPHASRAGAAALTGTSVEETSTSIGQARAAGLLQPETLAPTHPLIGEIAVERHPGAIIALWHERAAAVVAELGATNAERAHHLLRAGPPHWRRAVEACLAAAQDARATADHGGAVRHHRHALDVLSDHRDEVELTFEVTFGLADAEESAFGTRAAAPTYEAAVELARRTEDPARVARALAGHGIEYYVDPGVMADRLDRCAEALAALPPGDGPERARLLAQLATGALAGREVTRNRARAADAVAMARRLADPTTLGIALVAEQVADLGPATLDRRLAGAREILELALLSQQQELAIHGRFLLKAALLEHGDIRELDAQLAAQRAQIVALGEGRFRRHWLWFTCMRAMLDADAETVERVAAECGVLAEELQDPDGVSVYFGQLGMARWLQGRLPELEDAYLDRMRAEPAEPLWPAVLAWIAVHAGRLDTARGYAAHFVDPAAVPSSQHTLLTWFTMADVAAALGDQARMRGLREALLPYADRVVPIAMGAGCFGIVARPLGRLAQQLGRHDEAIRHYETALDRAGRLQARPFLVDAQLALAEALLDDPASRPRVRALVAEAAQVVADHRVQVFAPRVEALVERLARTAEPDTSGRAPRPRAAAALRPGSALPVRGVTVALDAEPSSRRTAQVRVLGAFEVVGFDGRLASWTSRRARVLLKILAAHRGAPVSREWLLAELWPGEAPDRLRNRLSVALTAVRRALDPERSVRPGQLIEVDRDSVRLVLDQVEVDAERFLVAFDAVGDRTGEERTAVAGALALWQGEALPDEPYAIWAEGLRSDVSFAALTLLRRALVLAAEDGDQLQVAEAARRILQLDAYDEAAHLALVTALDQLAAHGRADESWQRYRAAMVELDLPVAKDPRLRS